MSLDPRVVLAVGSYRHLVRDGHLAMSEFLMHAARHGVDGVELCDLTVDVTSADDAAQAADHHGLSIPSLALRNDFTRDARDARAQVDRIIMWFPVAHRLGAGIVRVWTGCRRDDDQARQQVRACFDELVPAAREAGLTLTVETFVGMSMDPGFLADLCGRYPAGSLGVCLDFGNIPPPGRRAVISAVAPLANHVHVKSYEFRDGVEADIPLAWAVGHVLASGYDGHWVIEYEGGPPYDNGILSTAKVLTEAGVMKPPERVPDVVV